MLFLGFVVGLLFLLVFIMFIFWFVEFDIKKVIIGYFVWVGIIYFIKVFWVFIVDCVLFFGLIVKMGKCCSWMLLV